MSSSHYLLVVSFINGQWCTDPGFIGVDPDTTMEEFLSICQVEMHLSQTPQYLYVLPYGATITSTRSFQALPPQARVIATDILGNFRESNIPPRLQARELTEHNLAIFTRMLEMLSTGSSRSPSPSPAPSLLSPISSTTEQLTDSSPPPAQN